jgi:hypothetical protein
MGIMLILAAAGCQKKIIDSGSALSGPGAGADGAGVAGDTDGMREEDLSAARAGGEGPVDEIVTADGVVMNRELFINQDIFFSPSTVRRSARKLSRF